MSLSRDDRVFLDYIEKKCHGTHPMSGGRGRGPSVHHDYHDTKLTEDELLRLIAITGNKDNDLVLVPNCTTFYFGGPAYLILQADKPTPFIPATFKSVVHWSQPQMPPGWNFERMKPHFVSEELVAYYGMDEFSRDEDSYVY